MMRPAELEPPYPLTFKLGRQKRDILMSDLGEYSGVCDILVNVVLVGNVVRARGNGEKVKLWKNTFISWRICRNILLFYWSTSLF